MLPVLLFGLGGTELMPKPIATNLFHPQLRSPMVIRMLTITTPQPLFVGAVARKSMERAMSGITTKLVWTSSSKYATQTWTALASQSGRDPGSTTIMFYILAQTDRVLLKIRIPMGIGTFSFAHQAGARIEIWADLQTIKPQLTNTVVNE